MASSSEVCYKDSLEVHLNYTVKVNYEKAHEAKKHS